MPVAGKAAGFQVQASKPGYRSCDAIGRYGGAISWFGLRPGHQQGASFVLRPGLYVAGIVVDEQGSPLGGVHIDSGSTDEYYIGPAQSDRNGRFEIFELPPRPPNFLAVKGPPELTFELPGFWSKKIDALYGLDDETLRNLRIELQRGKTVSGRLLDAAGKPVPTTLVEILAGKNRIRRTKVTDNAGCFQVAGLPRGEALLRAHAISIRQKARMSLVVDRDLDGVICEWNPIA